MNPIPFDQLAADYDIVVVGAGTAGCSFLDHVDPKYSVLCIDRKSFPRFKACSGILVRAGIAFFQEDEIPDWVLADRKPLDIRYVDWDNNLSWSSTKGFLNLWRPRFDRWLFERISNASADFISECRWIDACPAEDGQRVVVTIRKDGATRSTVCKYLVGCDGCHSLVRRMIDSKPVRYYVGVQEIIDQRFTEDAHFIFDSSVTDFYCWVVSKGERVEIGCALNPQRSKEAFDRFRGKVARKFGIRKRGEIHSATLFRPENLSDIFFGRGNVLLCGEAAALNTPSGGEGISNALLTGRFCAEAINEHFEGAVEDAYVSKCAPLLRRFEEKFEKAAAVADPESRRKRFP